MTMPSMTHRVLLIERPGASPSSPDSPKIRHYRLARTRLAASRREMPPRYEHLRKTYD
jgi:hypothetical protein